MSDLKLVVFDCDGTLVDSQHMIYAAMSRALAAHSLPPLPRETILSIVGLSLQEAVLSLLPDEDAGTRSLVVESYRNAFFHLREQPELHEPLFPGTREALDALAARDDVLLGVATGKSRRGLANILKLHDLESYFVTLQTADTHPSKPHPSMLHEAMDDTGVPAERTIIIGDTSYDMVMGTRAGALPVGVSWGYHPPHELKEHGAETVLNEFGELCPLLEAYWAEHQKTA